jgi:peptidyl-prolyl cis-trans isomerase SurA
VRQARGLGSRFGRNLIYDVMPMPFAERHVPPVRHSRLFSLAGAIAGGLLLAGCSALDNISSLNPFKEKPTLIEPTGPTKVNAGKIPGNDSIPIVVNDRPITSFDIAQRMRLMRISGAKADEKDAREDLIDEVLELEEGARVGLVVPEEQVEAAYASIAQNLKLSAADLTKALGGEGIEPSTLKRRLAAQITWQQLVAARARSSSQIKESEVTTALLAKGDPTSLKTKEYTLQQIVFVVPSGSAAASYDQRRREAEAFRQRFQGCENSLAQAKDLNGVVVKELGRRDATELRGADGDAIKNASAGSTLRPSQIAQGIEIIAVCAVKEIQSAAAARVDIQNQLFQKQSEGIAATYLKELRARATIVYR